MTTDITSINDAEAKRRNALLAVDALIASIMARFDNFSPDKASAWKPSFIDALVGTGSSPLYSASQIASAQRHIGMTWGKWDWPKPSEYAAHCSEIAGEDRAIERAASYPKQIAKILHLWDCQICGDKGEVAMYRFDDIPGWWRCTHPCGHSKEWLNDMARDGWHILRNMSSSDARAAMRQTEDVDNG